mgnify:CR=1 FL=1
MTSFSIIAVIVKIVFVLLFCISVYYNIKHGILIIRVQESIEDCLDVLDAKYKRMSEIVEMPIFFDSMEVRQVISDIKSTRDSVLYVANVLTGVGESKITTQQDENERL